MRRLASLLPLCLICFSCALICSADTPAISAVTNAADYSGSLSPGSLVTLFGTDFTTSSPASASSVPLPLTLDEVTIYVGSVQAPLLYVSATQINLQIPYETAVGATNIYLQTGTGAIGVPITVSASSPGIFQYATNRAIAVNFTGGQLNADSAPVSAGDTLIVYLDGIGPVSNTPADGAGSPSSPVASASDSYSASIGGLNAPISFLGLAPGFVGLGQANIQVPALAIGDYPLTITVNNVTSQSAIVSVSGSGAPPPSILAFLSAAQVPTTALQTNVHGLTVVQLSGTNAYVCSQDQITVLDVSNPQVPAVSGSFGSATFNSVGTLCQIDQTHLIELLNSTNILVYDLSISATNPQLVGGPVALQTPYAGNVVFDGPTAIFDTDSLSWSTSSLLILSETGVIETYNLSNFASPSYDASFMPPSGFTDNTAVRLGMANLGNHLIAALGSTNNGVNNGGGSASGEGQFTVIDVTNPANPVAVTEVMVPQTVELQTIALQGTTGLISGNTQALNNPIFYSGTVPEFLNDGNLTLTLIDFSNPQTPEILSTTVTGYQASTGSNVVSLGSGFFAIAIAPPVTDFLGAGTLAVIDARNTSAPVLYPLAVIDGVSSLAVEGNYLYATTNAGLNVYTITLP